MKFFDYKKPDNVTVREIAGRSKVSAATVSRIFNHSGKHQEETVNLVLQTAVDIADEKKMLINGPPPTNIGILAVAYYNFLCSTHTSVLFSSLIEELNRMGFSVSLIMPHNNQSPFEQLEKQLKYQRIKGLLIPEYNILYRVTGQLKKLHIPFVCINDSANHRQFYTIRNDDVFAGANAAAYLWNKGHRRFGVVNMGLANIPQRERVDGFLQELKRLGGAEKIWQWTFTKINEFVEPITTEIKNTANPPTAIFSTNSNITRTLYASLRNASVRIPEDISIISIEENGELGDLGITVMAQPVRAIGEAAVHMLEILMQNRKPKRRIETFNCILKARTSVASLPVNEGNDFVAELC